MNDLPTLLVLGAGVSGLSSGILLLKRGYSVVIWAENIPPNTTSNKAAAAWYPYLCNPRDKAIPWGKATYTYFMQNIVDDPASGCIRRKTLEIFTEPQDDPWWKGAIPSFRRPAMEELPSGYVDGYEIDGIVIDTSIYMDFLVRLYTKLGGRIELRKVTDIQEALDQYRVVINCTGLGSRDLLNDQALFPVRGQMVQVKANGFKNVVADDEGPNSLCIIVPRMNDIMLGGTTQVNDWNLEVDPQDTADILKKAAVLYPEFSSVEVIRESVGLRPCRNEIRLELENYSGKTVIHNYGHGGAGFTLSWGCAQDVVAFVDTAILH